MQMHASPKKFQDIFAGDSKMAQLMRSYDWDNSPMGPVALWPQSLKTMIRVILTSSQPMWIAWGKRMTMFHNDAYVPILGRRQPVALGLSAQETWPEVCHLMGLVPEAAMHEEQSASSVDQFLILERNCLREEVYLSFSCGPIPDDNGDVGGLFCTCVENSEKVIKERRLQTLAELADAIPKAESIPAIIDAALEVLAHDARDLPCVLYIPSAYGHLAWDQAVSFGIRDKDFFYRQLSLKAPESGAEHSLVFHDLDQIISFETELEDFDCPRDALLFPIYARDQSNQIGAMLFALSPHRPVDEDYIHFCKLAANQIEAALDTCRNQERMRTKVEDLLRTDREKTQFITKASQEFRTPLTFMLGPIQEIIQEEKADRATQDMLSIVQCNCVRLLKLVNQLLDVSRLDAGTIPCCTETTNLSQLTMELAAVDHAKEESEDHTLLEDEAKGKVSAADQASNKLLAIASKELILIVEDDKDMRAYLNHILKKQYELLFACNGREALTILEGHKPDLIISDVMMPEVDGFELLKIIRNDERLKTISVLLLTALVDQASSLKAMADGADDYMTKPFNSKELLSKVGSQIRLSAMRNAVAQREAHLRAEQEATDLSNRLKDEFLSVVAHELKTPLHGIYGLVQILNTTDSEARDLGKYLDIIESAIKTEIEVVEDIIAISELIFERAQFDFERIDLNDVLDAAVSKVKNLHSNGSYTIQVDRPAEEIAIRGDRYRVEQAIEKIIDNAIKFSDGNGRIEISISAENNFALLKIEDDGCGISKDFLPYAFDSFRQEDGSQCKKYGGLGIGLSLAKQIVMAHGGEIQLNSEGEGKGVACTIRFPMIKMESKTRWDQVGKKVIRHAFPT